MKSFKQSFESFCKKNSIKKNSEQLDLVEKFDEFHAIIKDDKTLLKKIFSKAPQKLGYYVYGDVGVGKTMICNEFYQYLEIKKKKTHFNKFMIEVHDFLQQNQNKDKAENLITQFARVLKDKIVGAKKTYNNFIQKNNIGAGRDFDRLDDYTKLLMTDTNYNAGLGIFKQMMTGIANNDIDYISQQYTVVSDGVPLGTRNEMRKNFLIRGLAQNKGLAGDRLETFLDNANPTGQGIMSKIGSFYKKSNVGQFISGQMQPAMPDSTAMSPQEYESYFLENTNVDNPYGPN